MADEKNPDIITVMPSAVKAVLIQLRQAISIRHIRGIHPFLGLGEEKPFTIPPREIVTRRCRFNALFFATNYTILVGTLSVLTMYVYTINYLNANCISLMNPLFLFAIVMVALGWAYVAKLANNDDEMNPILIAGRKVTSKERSLAMMGGMHYFFP